MTTIAAHDRSTVHPRPWARLLPWTLILFRLALAIAFWFIGPAWRFAAVLLAEASDRLDGYLARRLNVASRIGSMADAATDKLFIWSAFIALTVEGKLPWWAAALLAPRDIAVALRGALAYFRGRRVPADHRLLSKITTVAILAALLLVIALGFEHPATKIAGALAGTCSVAAAIDYLISRNPRGKR